jgi:hypothetical protein
VLWLYLLVELYTNVTKSTEVYYGALSSWYEILYQLLANCFSVANCGNPADRIDNTAVDIMGYMDPAVEGSNVTISCSSGYVLNGANTAICMRNGNWEPDPRQVECKSETYTG